MSETGRLLSSVISGYVIITSDGRVKSRGGKYSKASSAGFFYTSFVVARNQARAEGDSVVPVIIDLGAVEPVFIRAKVL